MGIYKNLDVLWTIFEFGRTWDVVLKPKEILHTCLICTHATFPATQAIIS